MAISLPQLRSFIVLSKHLSFKRAAIELEISQPALSSQIKELERFLGLQLLARTTRSVRLTPAGEGFVLRTKRLLSDLDAVLTGAQQPAADPRGVVVFACIPSIAGYLFPTIINRYRMKRPEVAIEMIDEETVGMERKIIYREVDFGVGGMPRRTEDLSFSQIYDDPFVLLCRRDHPLARRKSVSIAAATKYPIVSLARTSNVRETIMGHFAKMNRTFTPTFEVIHHFTLGAMVEANLGIAFLPAQAAAMAGPSPDLVTRNFSDRGFVRPVGLIARKGEALSPTALDFYSFAVEVMKANVDPPRLRNGVRRWS